MSACRQLDSECHRAAAGGRLSFAGSSDECTCITRSRQNAVTERSRCIQTCWVTAANVCLYVISSSRPPENTDFVQKYVGVLIVAVQQLARIYPLAGEWFNGDRRGRGAEVPSNQPCRRDSCYLFTPSCLLYLGLPSLHPLHCP